MKRLMKKRTKEFAKNIIKLCRRLPGNREGNLIANEIFRYATSVAANCRAACKARSKAESISKLSIAEEKADETLFWLELMKEVQIVDNTLLDSLMNENDEIIAIIVSSIRTSSKREQTTEAKI
ncbi:MAG: four helix bundle protein [Deltaproteobacteria bacterium]|nr:four helix bundle protein [Deltaproteobacteria bacterium]